MAEDDNLLHLDGRDLANSHQRPDWSTDSEFRANRDRSAPERGDSAPAAARPVTPPKKGERG
jgi:hypothetical protein